MLAQPPTTISRAPSTSTTPGWLSLLLVLLIVGLIAEGIGKISKTAGIMFALFVVLTFIATSDHTEQVAEFINNLYANLGADSKQ